MKGNMDILVARSEREWKRLLFLTDEKEPADVWLAFLDRVNIDAAVL